MKDTYLNNQNITNNIIIPKLFSNGKKQVIYSSEKSISYSSSVDDKNETIDNQINDSTSSFDYSETLRVSKIPKKEKSAICFERSRNFLAHLNRAVSGNFDVLNLSRKTNIINEKNKKEGNIINKRTQSDDKFLEKLKKNKLCPERDNKINDKEKNKISKTIFSKVVKIENKEKEKEKDKEKENIQINKNKNEQISKGMKTNKMCKNVHLNLASKIPKNNLTNNINHKPKEAKKLIKQQQNSPKQKIVSKPSNLPTRQNTVGLTRGNIKKTNSNQILLQQNSRIASVENSKNKNDTLSPRLTVPLNIKNNILNANKNKQINLDIKYNHIQSKSPKNCIVKKLYPIENNSLNKQRIQTSVSPTNTYQFGRQTVNINNYKNEINNYNPLINSVNINNFNVIERFDNNVELNHNNDIDIQNNFNINKNINLNPSNQRMTIATTNHTPVINTLINQQQQQQNNNYLYSPRLTNIPNQSYTQIPQINNNSPIIIQDQDINLILDNIEKYILSENEKINANTNNNIITKKDFNVTYNNFDASGFLKNYGILTLPGKDTSGLQKTNQDSFTFITNINGLKNFNIFGVLDGHGIEGHFVSKFASKFIPYQIINHPEIKNLNDPEMIYIKLKSNNYQIIQKSYLDCDIALQKVNFDSKESGCTCNLIFNIGKHIICANTGDSRAIVVYEDNNLMFQFNPLSIDFKPEMPEEMNRIINSGGEVRQMKNEIGEGVGPYRVWKQGEGYPGLAMSRSIGDLVGKKIGVIPNPGIIEYELNENSRYIVVCSDGVWEFLENENVKNIGIKYYNENDPSKYCHELVNTSFNLWEKNDIVVDDITAVVAFF